MQVLGLQTDNHINFQYPIHQMIHKLCGASCKVRSTSSKPKIRYVNYLICLNKMFCEKYTGFSNFWCMNNSNHLRRASDFTDTRLE